MQVSPVIPGELRSCFSVPFSFPGIGADPFPACICAAGGIGGGGSGGRLFGRCPGWCGAGHGREALRWPARPGRLRAAPWLVRPGLPALHGGGPAPGRWVKNRPERHQARAAAGGGHGGPVPGGGPAVIPIVPRSHTRHQMHRVPVSTRYVTIVRQGTAARRCVSAP